MGADPARRQPAEVVEVRSLPAGVRCPRGRRCSSFGLGRSRQPNPRRTVQLPGDSPASSDAGNPGQPPWSKNSLPATLSIGELLAGYRAQRFAVEDGHGACAGPDRAGAPAWHVWISLLDRARVMDYLRVLEGKSPDSLPLYGIPFAVKDNIDLEGVVTTAACPDYAYMPREVRARGAAV